MPPCTVNRETGMTVRGGGSLVFIYASSLFGACAGQISNLRRLTRPATSSASTLRRCGSAYVVDYLNPPSHYVGEAAQTGVALYLGGLAYEEFVQHAVQRDRQRMHIV